MNRAKLRSAYKGNDLCGMSHQQIKYALMTWYIMNGEREGTTDVGWLVLLEAGLLEWADRFENTLRITPKALELIKS